MTNSFAGTDSTGCVRLTTGGTGRVTKVTISALWRTKLGPERFTAAVIEALGRIAADFIAATDPFDSASVSSFSGPVVEVRSASIFEDMAPGQSSLAMHRLADLMDEVLTETTEHLERTRSASREYIGMDERKHVKVTMFESGVVGSLDIDEDWLAAASTERLGRVLHDALQAGYECIDHAKVLDLHERPATQKLRTLRDDPDAFQRWLRAEEQ